MRCVFLLALSLLTLGVESSQSGSHQGGRYGKLSHGSKHADDHGQYVVNSYNVGERGQGGNKASYGKGYYRKKILTDYNFGGSDTSFHKDGKRFKKGYGSDYDQKDHDSYYDKDDFHDKHGVAYNKYRENYGQDRKYGGEDYYGKKDKHGYHSEDHHYGGDKGHYSKDKGSHSGGGHSYGKPHGGGGYGGGGHGGGHGGGYGGGYGGGHGGGGHGGGGYGGGGHGGHGGGGHGGGYGGHGGGYGGGHGGGYH